VNCTVWVDNPKLDYAKSTWTVSTGLPKHLISAITMWGVVFLSTLTQHQQKWSPWRGNSNYVIICNLWRYNNTLVYIGVFFFHVAGVCVGGIQNSNGKQRHIQSMTG
jgi:hypothetical protein